MKGFCRIAALVGFILMTAFAQAEEPTEILRADVGSIVTFGLYEQDGNPDNGQEKIEWIVLDAQKESRLLLSRYCLDAKPYHSKGKNITWKDSALRKWLNSDFLNIAFLPEEQDMIAVTVVDNSRKQGYPKWKKTKGGKNTRDRIFLLSCAEASQYFNVAFNGPYNPISCAEPTPYAVGKGAYCEEVREGNSSDIPYAWWWLRSPGYVQNAAAGVGGSGTLLDSGVNWEEACVRPALWVKLDQRAGIFLAEQPLRGKKTCGDYTYAILENGSAEIVRYSGRNNAVMIPGELDGHPVSAIGEAAFEGCSYVTSVVVPDGVKTIGDDAFLCCEGLLSVTLPDSMEVIGTAAFTGCSGLTSVMIPNGVRIIGRDAFFGCKGLTSISIPDSVEEIGISAFANCSGLTSITFPDNVKTLGEFVFSSCTGLTSVTLPDDCAVIPAFAFSGCNSLKSITLPGGVREIGTRAFWKCEIMTSVTIPVTVTTIGDEAFGGCSELHSVRIAANVTAIGENAFHGCAEGLTVAVDRGSYAERYCEQNGIKHSY